MLRRLPLLRLIGLFVLGLLSPQLAQATELKLWHAYRGAEEQALVEGMTKESKHLISYLWKWMVLIRMKVSLLLQLLIDQTY